MGYFVIQRDDGRFSGSASRIDWVYGIDYARTYRGEQCARARIRRYEASKPYLKGKLSLRWAEVTLHGVSEVSA